MSKHTIKQQDTKVVEYRHDFESPYHQWIEQHGYLNEPVEANPDQLEDKPENNFFANRGDKSMAKILISRFLDEQGNFPTLSPKENQVLRLYTAGKSMSEVATELKIKKGTVQLYLGRCSKKLKKLLNGVKDVEF
jgi:DNA-binding CsgD family transcriptional regulator